MLIAMVGGRVDDRRESVAASPVGTRLAGERVMLELLLFDDETPVHKPLAYGDDSTGLLLLVAAQPEPVEFANDVVVSTRTRHAV